MYLLGFGEAVVQDIGNTIIDEEWDATLIALLGLAFLFLLCFSGSKHVIKFQIGLLLFLGIVILWFLGGALLSANSEFEGVLSPGFDNYWSVNGNTDPIEHDDTIFRNFEAAFDAQEDLYPIGERLLNDRDGTITLAIALSVIFPAFAGLMTGASISGDLKHPNKSLPLGIFCALAVGGAVYIVATIIVGISAPRQIYLGSQDWSGLLHDRLIVAKMSLWEPLVSFGLYVSSLASALAALFGAPRLLRAITKDNLYNWMSFLRCKEGQSEPYRGYTITTLIAACLIITTNLNKASLLITLSFIAAYCVVNFACLMAMINNSPGWRPTFRFSNKYTSFAGVALCITIMMYLSWIISLVVLGAMACLYKYIDLHVANEINWGSAQAGHQYKLATNTILMLDKVKEHVKNWRPQWLFLSGDVSIRPAFLWMAISMRKGKGISIFGNVLRDEDATPKNRKTIEAKLQVFLKANGVKGFTHVVSAPSLYVGVENLFQLAGLGRLRPNTVCLGFREKWLPRKYLNQENMTHNETDLKNKDKNEQNLLETSKTIETKTDMPNTPISTTKSITSPKTTSTSQKVRKRGSVTFLTPTKQQYTSKRPMMTDIFSQINIHDGRDGRDNKTTSTATTTNKSMTMMNMNEDSPRMAALSPPSSTASRIDEEHSSVISSPTSGLQSSEQNITSNDHTIQDTDDDDDAVAEECKENEIKIQFVDEEYDNDDSNSIPHARTVTVKGDDLQKQNVRVIAPSSVSMLVKTSSMMTTTTTTDTAKGIETAAATTTAKTTTTTIPVSNTDMHPFSNKKVDNGVPKSKKNNSSRSTEVDKTISSTTVSTTLSTLSPSSSKRPLVDSTSSKSTSITQSSPASSAVFALVPTDISLPTKITSMNNKSNVFATSSTTVLAERASMSTKRKSIVRHSESTALETMMATTTSINKKEIDDEMPLSPIESIKNIPLPFQKSITITRSTSESEIISPTCEPEEIKRSHSNKIKFSKAEMKAIFDEEDAAPSKHQSLSSMIRSKFSSFTNLLNIFAPNEVQKATNMNTKKNGQTTKESESEERSSNHETSSTMTKSRGTLTASMNDMKAQFRQQFKKRKRRLNPRGYTSTFLRALKDTEDYDKRMEKKLESEQFIDSHRAKENEEYVKMIGSSFDNGFGCLILRHEELFVETCQKLQGDLDGESINRTSSQTRPIIDVWWLVDDGGFTALLPHIMKRCSVWENARVRIIATAKNEVALAVYTVRLENMMKKFRMDYEIEPVLNPKPNVISAAEFNEVKRRGITLPSEDLEQCNFYIHLGHLIKQHSSESDLVLVSLPVPRVKQNINVYMTNLEMLSIIEKPVFMIRGNQKNALTFYS
eukprot:TRINITY_DN3578_c2_g2_i1.p1 TRINITY_DN3578_c2_g2~~TRINITY_DN3578_c2_g2_i1.p1  ORF type:complete len:1390 (+),score=391.46 TRINITY_DN3578_c2_g2_i1:129-4172(+)